MLQASVAEVLSQVPMLEEPNKETQLFEKGLTVT